MSASARVSVVFLMTMAIHGAPAVAQDQHPLPGGKDRWATKTVARNGIELSVEVDRQSFAGGALVIRVTIRNNGKDELRVMGSGHRAFAINVLGQDRTPVPMTRFFQKKLVGESTGGKSPTLSPGNAYYSKVYNLSRLFDLTMSGQYTVSVSKTYYSPDMSQNASLEVADFGFKVREPKSEDWSAIWKAPKD